MLAALVRRAGLEDCSTPFSRSTRSAFQDPPEGLSIALDLLGLKASAISFQSSNAWDAHGASAFGMRVVWCNRYGQRGERLPGSPDLQITSLAELPTLVGAG